MDNQVVRREVQRCDDPFGIPACFYWSVDEVADWVESIGYGKYKENFRSNFINGRKLLTVDACTLPQLGIVHFGDILAIAKIIRYQLGVENHKKFDSQVKRGVYMNKSKEYGRRKPSLTYAQFVMRNELALDAKTRYFKTKGYYYSGWEMEPHWSEELVAEEKKVNQALHLFKLKEKEKFKIGTSIQERLREVTLRKVNAADNATGSGGKNQKGRHPMSTAAAGANESSHPAISAGESGGNIVHDPITSHKPLTHEDEIARAKREKHERNERVTARREPPFLPILFCWKKMEPSAGYPPLKVEIKRDVCSTLK